ncbi:hypothetical protein EDEG_02980 [Edhazardia aedis USNM 41457]|uniref:Uncharacterized protein n=1 Tax=Edhazardia aedis (strain USNM 41457) TaxID=1003232 RepID=J9DMR1_EDHAE|nr:hypothetical protein EDEG_02980 [Edhazardia aedis USNM 41457]|eukprot:EJW02622.1 hypothetical protein EDEG_02980 [Edhazardia aedis USNM 41457]
MNSETNFKKTNLSACQHNESLYKLSANSIKTSNMVLYEECSILSLPESFEFMFNKNSCRMWSNKIGTFSKSNYILNTAYFSNNSNIPTNHENDVSVLIGNLIFKSLQSLKKFKNQNECKYNKKTLYTIQSLLRTLSLYKIQNLLVEYDYPQKIHEQYKNSLKGTNIKKQSQTNNTTNNKINKNINKVQYQLNTKIHSFSSNINNQPNLINNILEDSKKLLKNQSKKTYHTQTVQKNNKHTKFRTSKFNTKN